MGPPTVTADADVDIYDKPGGVGTKIGILRKGSKVSFLRENRINGVAFPASLLGQTQSGLSGAGRASS